ncbi:hypothetical protein [Streptomyces sp. GMY02]|uniref:hypothetical protein n=1 Tax=Streptomyces sp. GMY02 TaxID=1333528 RepID=UPI00349F6E31
MRATTAVTAASAPRLLGAADVLRAMPMASAVDALRRALGADWTRSPIRPVRSCPSRTASSS